MIARVITGTSSSPSRRSDTDSVEVLRRVKASFADAHRFAALTRLPRFPVLGSYRIGGKKQLRSSHAAQLLRCRQPNVIADPAT